MLSPILASPRIEKSTKILQWLLLLETSSDLQETSSDLLQHVCSGAWTSPSTKIIHLPTSLFPLWGGISELSEMLCPGLESSFCRKSNVTQNSHIVLFFFFFFNRQQHQRCLLLANAPGFFPIPAQRSAYPAFFLCTFTPETIT